MQLPNCRGCEHNKHSVLFEQSVSEPNQNQVSFNRYAANIRAIAGKFSQLSLIKKYKACSQWKRLGNVTGFSVVL